MRHQDQWRPALGGDPPQLAQRRACLTDVVASDDQLLAAIGGAASSTRRPRLTPCAVAVSTHAMCVAAAAAVCSAPSVRGRGVEHARRPRSTPCACVAVAADPRRRASPPRARGRLVTASRASVPQSITVSPCASRACASNTQLGGRPGARRTRVRSRGRAVRPARSRRCRRRAGPLRRAARRARRASAATSTPAHAARPPLGPPVSATSTGSVHCRAAASAIR